MANLYGHSFKGVVLHWQVAKWTCKSGHRVVSKLEVHEKVHTKEFTLNILKVQFVNLNDRFWVRKDVAERNPTKPAIETDYRVVSQCGLSGGSLHWEEDHFNYRVQKSESQWNDNSFHGNPKALYSAWIRGLIDEDSNLEYNLDEAFKR